MQHCLEWYKLVLRTYSSTAVIELNVTVLSRMNRKTVSGAVSVERAAAKHSSSTLRSAYSCRRSTPRDGDDRTTMY